MASGRRSVISGVGALSPTGIRRKPFWDAVLEGRSAVTPITAFDPSGLPVRIAATIPSFDAKEYIDKKDRKQLRMMARPIQMAVSAAALALEDCKVDKTKLEKTRFGVLFGSCMIPTELPDLVAPGKMCVGAEPRKVDMVKWGTEGIPAIQPLWMLKYLPNMLACQVSIFHDAQGPNNTITENDVAGLLAFGESMRLLERDWADFFLVGGAEAKINPLSMTRQCLFENLSKKNDTPQEALRPFDRDSDGTVIGEGAGVVVLEELGHAQKRGAEILAEVAGFGSAFDRAKDGTGLARAIGSALKEAEVGPDAIDFIAAHGVGSQVSDRFEAAGYRKAFGEGKVPPVFALKPLTGNIGCGSGILELGAAALALASGIRPSSINCPHPDPECGLPVPMGPPGRIQKTHVLKVSITTLGQTAAVVLKKFA